ncbi:sugar phosphate isomerase/epimerase family protein [Heyndrickxia sp. NPDC080065]|uniref:sugar phosphate isomerase/epimerase family protein n=1 Tax=Heyndrickxia sp. NPDC080065 TaxID=3390568 RepID=UPI003D049B91
MKRDICYSDLVLINNDIFENINDLIKHGANKIELMMDGEKWDDMEDLFEDFSSKLKALPVGYTIHPPAWDINLTSENKAIREASFSEYKKAIEFASMIGAGHVVIHPGFCFSPIFDKKLAQQRAAFYIKRLCEVAKPLNVKLAIENVGYNGSSLFTQNEFTSFLEVMDETAGYLIDIGHAHLNGWNIPQLIKDTKDQLLALHIHDNNGTGDDHLPIGEGSIQWKEIFAMINEHSVDCQLILEYAPATPLKELRKGKELLQNKVLI